MNKIPEIINNFNIYLDGNKAVGVTGEVTLPDFEAITETISGAGILGEYDSVNVGQFSAQEIEVPFRLNEGNVYLLQSNDFSNLTLRGSMQISDGTGVKKYQGLKVILRGASKKLTSGKVSAGKPMEASVTLALTYIKVEIDDETAIELDKLNSVYIVDGVDRLEAIKALI